MPQSVIVESGVICHGSNGSGWVCQSCWMRTALRDRAALGLQLPRRLGAKSRQPVRPKRPHRPSTVHPPPTPLRLVRPTLRLDALVRRGAADDRRGVRPSAAGTDTANKDAACSPWTSDVCRHPNSYRGLQHQPGQDGRSVVLDGRCEEDIGQLYRGASTNGRSPRRSWQSMEWRWRLRSAPPASSAVSGVTSMARRRRPAYPRAGARRRPAHGRGGARQQNVSAEPRRL